MNLKFKLKLKATGTIWLIATERELKLSDQAKLKQQVEQFESAFSRFKTDSELGILNASEILKTPSKKMLELLRFALESYQKTDGLFNISVGGKLESSGYGLKNGGAKTSNNLSQDIEITDSEVKLSRVIHLDFGGFGKGWLADELHLSLNKMGHYNHLINAGGDIRLGAQTEQELLLTDPLNKDHFIAKLNVSGGALACSSNNLRTWDFNNKKQQHILSLNSDRINILGSFVYGENLGVADMLATSLMLASGEQRVIINNNYPDYEYLLVTDDGYIKTNNWKGGLELL